MSCLASETFTVLPSSKLQHCCTLCRFHVAEDIPNIIYNIQLDNIQALIERDGEESGIWKTEDMSGFLFRDGRQCGFSLLVNLFVNGVRGDHSPDSDRFLLTETN
jgi:hypothetical protein